MAQSLQNCIKNYQELLDGQKGMRVFLSGMILCNFLIWIWIAFDFTLQESLVFMLVQFPLIAMASYMLYELRKFRISSFNRMLMLMRGFSQSWKVVQRGYEDLASYEPIASKKVEELSIKIAELNECIHLFEQQYKKTTYAWF